VAAIPERARAELTTPPRNPPPTTLAPTPSRHGAVPQPLRLHRRHHARRLHQPLFRLRWVNQPRPLDVRHLARRRNHYEISVLPSSAVAGTIEEAMDAPAASTSTTPAPGSYPANVHCRRTSDQEALVTFGVGSEHNPCSTKCVRSGAGSSRGEMVLWASSVTVTSS
jgi:hypothetical protein